MKYIEVKEAIPIVVNGHPWMDSDGSKMPSWSFVRYLENIVLPDPAIGTKYKELKACSILEKQFESAAPGKWVGVEDAHWEMIKVAVEEPKGGGIHPGVLRQFLPFMDAILDAKAEKPRED